MLKFDYYNGLFATDYQYRYKLNGIDIINDIINLDFSSNFNIFGGIGHDAFINSYFISELITGFLLHIFKTNIFFQ